MPRKYYIEFVGPPGCGKTTVAAEVLRKLAQEGYRVVAGKGPAGPVFPRSLNNFKFLIRFPV